MTTGVIVRAGTGGRQRRRRRTYLRSWKGSHKRKSLAYWPFTKLCPQTQKGQSASVSSDRSDNYTAVPHWDSCNLFRFLFIFRLVLWIFEFVKHCLLKVMLVIQWGSKEMYVLYLYKIKRCWTPHSLTSTELDYHCFSNPLINFGAMLSCY